MSQSEPDHNEIIKLLRENQELIKQNNTLLRKLYRYSIIGFAAKLLWYAILIGLPFILYFYVLEPYFEVFGANYELFKQGISEVPGLKGLEKLLPSANW